MCLHAWHPPRHKKPKSKSDGLPPKRETRIYSLPMATCQLEPHKGRGLWGDKGPAGSMTGAACCLGGEQKLSSIPFLIQKAALDHGEHNSSAKPSSPEIQNKDHAQNLGKYMGKKNLKASKRREHILLFNPTLRSVELTISVANKERG